MSTLRVLWPEEAPPVSLFSGEEPSILPFAVSSAPRNRLDVISRARALFNNRACSACGYPVVEPIELADGISNRNGITIPGTATLVGFRCCGCKNEWSV